MRNRTINFALTGAFAAAIAFTAVPAQIVFASSANAMQYGAARNGHFHRTHGYRYRHVSPNCTFQAWGYTFTCNS